MKNIQTVMACLVLVIGFVAAAFAQPRGPGDVYPNKAIRMIVPVTPGGSTDVVGRIIANKLGEGFGQQVVIDNRAGAGSIAGSEIVARATPDGYTLLFGYVTHTTTPFLHRNVPFDPIKDFSPVSLVAIQPLVVVVIPSVPANSLKELIALARAQPGKLNYGLAATGSAGHIAGEMFKQATNTNIVAIPYKGGGPVQLALLSGEVQLAFASSTTALPQIKTGKIKVLATTGKNRLPYLPEVPTIEEAAGIKGFEVAPWQGILAPARMSRLVIERLHSEVVKLLKQPDTLERLAATGSDAVGSTPQEFASHLKRELEQFGKVIKAAGIKAN